MSKKNAAAPADDSDLDDLLAGGKGGDSTETAPLNLDHLTQGKLDVPRRQAQFNAMSITDVATAYCNYICYQYPSLCTCFALSFILLFVVILVNATLNPTEEFGVLKQDFSEIGTHGLTNIRSEFDGKMGQIDHWCLNGGNERCRCEDPLTPQSRAQYKAWVNIYKKNKQQIVAYQDSDLLDVAFLGESLVEEMDGRWLGRDDSDELKAIGKIFSRRFKKQKRPENVEGVALGIAGDTTPNVLWRIMHGEMPDNFNPRVWWISLGMNDLGRSQCSEEVVVIGILRVVEEIRIRKPNARIVINSLLPMADLRGGIFPLATDYKDAFRQGRGRNPPQVDSSRYVPKTTLTEAEPVAVKAEPVDKAARKPKGSNREVERPKKGKGGKDSSRRRFLKKKLGKQQEEPKPEDAVDEAELRRQKRMEFHQRMRRDPVNPKLNPYQHKMRKYDAHKLFLQKNRLPLWTSIHAINEELKKFCDKHDHITFFDATEIFAERSEGGQYVLLSERISIRGHPTVLGFEKWEDAIVGHLKKLLPKIKEQPAKSGTQPQAQTDKTDQLNIRSVTLPPKKEESKDNTDSKNGQDKEKEGEDKKKDDKEGEDKKKEGNEGEGKKKEGKVREGKKKEGEEVDEKAKEGDKKKDKGEKKKGGDKKEEEDDSKDDKRRT